MEKNDEKNKVKKTVKKKTTSSNKTLKKEAETKVKKDTKPKKIVDEEKKAKVIETKEEKREVKEKVSKEELSIDKKSQKSLKILSRIISILAKIGRICLMIVVPFIFVFMIAIPFLVNKIEVDGNIIKFDDARMIINGEYVTFKVGDSKYVSNEEIAELSDIAKFIEENPKSRIILFAVSAMLFAGFTLIILIYILSYIEKLFDNIYRKKTPFTETNAKYIYNIGNLLVVNAIVELVFGIIFELAYPKANLIAGYRSISLLEILVIFAVYYVFRYGVKLQEKSNIEIYD